MSDETTTRSDQVPAEGESIYGPKARADYVIDGASGCWVWLKTLDAAGYRGATVTASHTARTTNARTAHSRRDTTSTTDARTGAA